MFTGASCHRKKGGRVSFAPTIHLHGVKDIAIIPPDHCRQSELWARQRLSPSSVGGMFAGAVKVSALSSYLSPIVVKIAKPCRGLRPVVNTQLPNDVMQMDLHGMLRQPAFGGNQLVLKAV
jgi:hypothetical protein